MQSSLEILTEALPCHIGIYPWENPTLSTWVSKGCTPCYRHRIPVGFGISCTSKHVKRMKCRVPRLHYCHSPHIPLLSCTWLCASSEGLERNLGTPPQLLRFSAFSLRRPKRQTGKKPPEVHKIPAPPKMQLLTPNLGRIPGASNTAAIPPGAEPAGCSA